MVSSFSSVSFVHISRSANEVAHMLARSSKLAAHSTYRHCIPGCIQNLVNSEFCVNKCVIFDQIFFFDLGLGQISFPIVI